jgi:hypothetical protein
MNAANAERGRVEMIHYMVGIPAKTLKISLATILLGLAAQAQQTLNKDNIVPSKFDLFAGYTAWLPNATIEGNHLSNSRQGLIVSGAYYLTPTFGLELSGDYHIATGNNSMRSVALGPIVRRPVAHDFTVFGHILGGAAEFVGPPYTIFIGTIYQEDRRLGPAWGPQLTIGGGIDWAVPFFHHRLTLRLLQADYLYEYFHLDPSSAVVGSSNLNTLRLNSGIVFRFGEVQAPPPVVLACTATPQNVLPGELLTVNGEASHLNRHKEATFHWTGPGVGQGEFNPAVTVDTTGLEPGTYRIGGQVSEGPRAGQSAHCTALFKVMQVPK